MRNALWWVIVIRGALGVVLMYMATDLIKIASRDRVALGAHGLNGIYRITLNSQVIIGFCHLAQLLLVTLTAFVAYSSYKMMAPDAPVEQVVFRFYGNFFLFVYTLLAGVIIVRKKYERALLYREAEIEIAKKAREEVESLRAVIEEQRDTAKTLAAATESGVGATLHNIEANTEKTARNTEPVK